MIGNLNLTLFPHKVAVHVCNIKKASSAALKTENCVSSLEILRCSPRPPFIAASLCVFLFSVLYLLTKKACSVGVTSGG